MENFRVTFDGVARHGPFRLEHVEFCGEFGNPVSREDLLRTGTDTRHPTLVPADCGTCWREADRTSKPAGEA
jgi:hypothetical protein